MSNVTLKDHQVIAFRLQVHHLNEKVSFDQLNEVTGVIGIQNSPPGAWENAIFHRIENCSLPKLSKQLDDQKTLLQAWSFRGVPLVFPTALSDVFLRALIPFNDELPWIYTLGLSGALDSLGMEFDDLLQRLRNTITYLDSQTIQSKELLDTTLANLIYDDLPTDKQLLWNSPSMYGANQRVGEAVVSFLLRPCSHSSLVVFGKRLNHLPTFTSYNNWLQAMPIHIDDPEKILVRKYLHAYAPSQISDFMKWLGCSNKQAKRLWNLVSDEMIPVEFHGKTKYLLQEDLEVIQSTTMEESKISLIHAHDPYLDLRDRTTILNEERLHCKVWKMVGNPNVLLRAGKIIGIWTSRTLNNKISVSLTHWEDLQASEIKEINKLLNDYANFRSLEVKRITIAPMTQ